MITTDMIRRLLGVADLAKDPYAVAGAAMALLGADRNDAVARDYYVKSLAALKMTAAAARVLGTAPVNAGDGSGGGLVPWASRARRFAANLRALSARTLEGAALVKTAAAELAARFELHTAGDGNYQVLEASTGRWLGGLNDHKGANRLWQFDRAKTPVPQAIVFDGLGFGWLFSHVMATTANSFLTYSCAIYALEPDPLALAMLLHMHDMQDLIVQERVRWFVGGGEVLEQMINAVRENSAWTGPDRYVRCALRGTPERATLDVEKGIKVLGEERAGQREQRVAAARELYAGRDAAAWAARYEEAKGGGEKLRVLGITSRYTTVLQHAMSELKAAVESVGIGAGGCVMDISLEADDQSLENPFLERIAEFKPDLIVQISRMRYENPWMPRGVPFLTWDQDNLACMRTAEATGSLDELTFVAGNGAVHGYEVLGWPRRNVIFCLAAGASHRYSDAPAAADLLAKHACDFSYVSNAAGTPEELKAQLAERWRNAGALWGLFEEAMGKVLARTAKGETLGPDLLRAMVQNGAISRRILPAAGMMKAAPAELTRYLQEMLFDLKTVADRSFRHVTLGWISKWCDGHGKTLRIYGNGWARHATLATHAAGPALPGEEVRAIYQASRVNLQLIETGFIHSRVLDGLAAGGFFLTRRVFNDGDDLGLADAHYFVGMRAEALGKRTMAEIDAVAGGDEVLRKYWPLLRGHLAARGVGPGALIVEWPIWAACPPPTAAFPKFKEIAFAGDAELGALAEKYLGDEELRRAMAKEFREIVLRDFSYDARWRQFSLGISAGLMKGTGEQVK